MTLGTISPPPAPSFSADLLVLPHRLLNLSVHEGLGAFLP